MHEIRTWTITQSVFEQNMDKFYRAYVIDDLVFFQWGRIGAMGQFQVKQSSDPLSAAMRKLDKKVSEGYSYTGGGFTHSEQRFIFTGQLRADKEGARDLAIAFNEHNREANRPRPELHLGKRSPAWPRQAEPPTPREVALPERALAALTLAATDPAEAMAVYPALREELTERENEVERIGSYLSTLEQLLANAMGTIT